MDLASGRPLLNEWDSPLPGAWQLCFDVVAPADGKLAWRVRFSTSCEILLILL